MDQSCVIQENNEEYSLPWAGPQAAEMRASPLFLCLFSTSCWVTLVPTAGDKILHFGACRVSLSLAEIRAGFTAIKANIVSIFLGEPLAAPGAPLGPAAPSLSSLQQSRDPIRTLSILSHPHSLHRVKVGGPAWGEPLQDPKAGECDPEKCNLAQISNFQPSHTGQGLLFRSQPLISSCKISWFHLVRFAEDASPGKPA